MSSEEILLTPKTRNLLKLPATTNLNHRPEFNRFCRIWTWFQNIVVQFSNQLF